MFHTEAAAPGNHPEIGFKVLILDLAVWIESQELPAPGMDSQNVHSSSGTCLPIGHISIPRAGRKSKSCQEDETTSFL